MPTKDYILVPKHVEDVVKWELTKLKEFFNDNDKDDDRIKTNIWEHWTCSTIFFINRVDIRTRKFLQIPLLEKRRKYGYRVE